MGRDILFFSYLPRKTRTFKSEKGNAELHPCLKIKPAHLTDESKLDQFGCQFLDIVICKTGKGLHPRSRLHC